MAKIRGKKAKKRVEKVEDLNNFLAELEPLMKKYNIAISARESLHCIWTKNDKARGEAISAMKDFNPDWEYWN